MFAKYFVKFFWCKQYYWVNNIVRIIYRYGNSYRFGLIKRQTDCRKYYDF